MIGLLPAGHSFQEDGLPRLEDLVQGLSAFGLQKEGSRHHGIQGLTDQTLRVELVVVPEDPIGEYHIQIGVQEQYGERNGLKDLIVEGLEVSGLLKELSIVNQPCDLVRQDLHCGKVVVVEGVLLPAL